MLCMRGTSHGHVSVCLSVTSLNSTKTAKHRITYTTPHDSPGNVHRESKKQDTKLLAITSLTIIRFSKIFTSRLRNKFETNLCLNIPPRFKHVATLPCEI